MGKKISATKFDPLISDSRPWYQTQYMTHMRPGSSQPFSFCTWRLSYSFLLLPWAACF